MSRAFTRLDISKLPPVPDGTLFADALGILRATEYKRTTTRTLYRHIEEGTLPAYRADTLGKAQPMVVVLRQDLDRLHLRRDKKRGNLITPPSSNN